MLEELFLSYTTPQGDMGYVRADHIVAMETVKGLGLPYTGIKTEDGLILQATETPQELLERMMAANG